MSYKANSGRAYFKPEKEIENGVWTSGISWRPLFEVQGYDGSPSWCVDRRVFCLELPRYGVHTIRKVDQKNGVVYSVSREDFERYGKVIGLGHGAQVALPMCFWTISRFEVKRAKPKSPRIVKPKKPAKQWLQRSFLGG